MVLLKEDRQPAVERTRNMRGENLGHAWLYESAKLLPAGKWGYKYWDALEYLKNRGVTAYRYWFPADYY